MKCAICGTESKGELCKGHAEAERRVREHFRVWSERMQVTWEEYLEMIERNEFSGKWVREVVRYLSAGAKS